MSLFEFLMVMVSIIIGLGIGELLTGVARQIRNRSSVRHYWVHSTLIATGFIALLQQWWEFWSLADVAQWTFIGAVMMLSGPIGLFLMSHLVFPEQMRDVNMREYHHGPMRPVFWIGCATVILASTFRPIVLGGNLFALDNATSFVGVAGFAMLAMSRRHVVHAVILPLFLALILLDILQFTYSIG